MTDWIDFRNPDTGRVSHTTYGSRTYNRAIAEGWQRLTPLQVTAVRRDIVAALPPEPVVGVAQDQRVNDSWIVVEPTIAPTTTGTGIVLDIGDRGDGDVGATAWSAMESPIGDDVDRPRRDPYAFADVDPDYATQIQLRQDVQQLGRAVQADPTSAVAKQRLKDKYGDYLDVRAARGAVMPSAAVQARAVDPRGPAQLAADMALMEPPAPRLEPIRPTVVEPVVEPVVPGLDARADSGIRKLLFLGIVAGIAKALLRD